MCGAVFPIFVHITASQILTCRRMRCIIKARKYFLLEGYSMSHKKKAHQNQKKADSLTVNNPNKAPSGNLIHQSGIIARGVSTKHSTRPISYIVYCEGQRVMICSDFKPAGNGMICCTYGYSRTLCNSLVEYKEITKEKIEMEAYQAWMTGAH